PDLPPTDALDTVLNVPTESSGGDLFGLPTLEPGGSFADEFPEGMVLRTEADPAAAVPTTTDDPATAAPRATVSTTAAFPSAPAPERASEPEPQSRPEPEPTASPETEVGTGPEVGTATEPATAPESRSFAEEVLSHPVFQTPEGGSTPDLPEGAYGPGREIPAGLTVGALNLAQFHALNALPPRPGVFVVGMTTGPQGAPDADTTLKALVKANDAGRLDGITHLQFTACSLATVSPDTVRTVMSGLWKHRAATRTDALGPDPLKALAADAPVWYVPTTSTDPSDMSHTSDASGTSDAPDTPTGRLVTAQRIGVTSLGTPALVTDDTSAWHEYSDTGDPDRTPATTVLPTTLPDGFVRTFSGPEHAVPDFEDAVHFGPPERHVELDKLGTRTSGTTTAYLVLPNPVQEVAGRSDAFLRTRGRPYATLTTQRPPAGRTLLEVTVPQGRAVSTGEGVLLIGKDDLAQVTVTAVATDGSPQQPWQEQAGSDLVGRPLSVLTRLGQALHSHPGRTMADPVVRVALRIAYADASRQIERPLGEFAGRQVVVQQQVQRLVRAIWDRLDDKHRVLLGSDSATGSGSVGNELAALEEVVEHGNIREQMYMLGQAVHGHALDGVLKLRKSSPRILTREWGASQQSTEVLRHVQERQRDLLATMEPGPERDALMAELDRLLETDLSPDEVQPPLSPRERRHAVRDGRLTWVPGERTRQIAMGNESQVVAESTGGLMSAGTSNTTYFMMEAVHLMSRAWKLDVDFQLLRLALLADMLPVGHHTFHEVMTAADAFGTDVLRNDSLAYSDDWGKFRTLPPLTEDMLRGAMPDERFPDEIALGLEAGETLPPELVTESNPKVTPGTGPLSRILPEDSWWLLLADPDRREAGPSGSRPDHGDDAGRRERVAHLIREVLDDKRGTGDDWRGLHSRSYRELHRRIEGAEATWEPQVGAMDELDSIWARFHPQPQDTSGPDGQDGGAGHALTPEERLDAVFDRYYEDVSRPGGPQERLRDVARAVQGLQQVAGLGLSTEARITADVRILAQRFLLDQGFPPALLPAEGYTPEFWQRPVDLIADDLATGVAEFVRLTSGLRSQDLPGGIMVGDLSASQIWALRHLPPRPGVFVVGMHTGPQGAPDADTVLRALVEANDTGKLDGITHLQFTACSLATVSPDTVRTVMSGLWNHRAATHPD
ncbi:hypothetical protein, partial [Streptomyces sp. WAC06614]|uniref:hypothetical protein n=1 Tax=Streptomyces sp. WAC06614 TaxID=2487416 RepID=UPI00163BA349